MEAEVEMVSKLSGNWLGFVLIEPNFLVITTTFS